MILEKGNSTDLKTFLPLINKLSSETNSFPVLRIQTYLFRFLLGSIFQAK